MYGVSVLFRVVAAYGLLIAVSLSAGAQKAAPDKCLAFAQAPDRGIVWHASVRQAALKPFQVGLNYLGHSTFLLESPKGVTIATEFQRLHFD